MGNIHLGVYIFIEEVIDGETSILLVKKNRGPYSGKYDLPGGKIEPNEEILEGLNREIQEELGVCINVYKYTDENPLVIQYLSSEINHIAIVFKLSGYSISLEMRKHKDVTSSDTSGWEWVKLRDLLGPKSSCGSPIVMELLERAGS
jgi:8-oxo-dGTP pyrophosphatase MutT (NUDIX family)